MNTVIYLIRHGEVEYPLDEYGNKLMYRPEASLSSLGVEEIESLSKRLQERSVRLDVIHTSSYARAKASAQILAKYLGNPKIIPDEQFVDPWIPGWWGIPLYLHQELDEKGDDIYNHPRSKDQETRDHLAKRVFEGFLSVLKENSGRIVGIVSHGDPIRLMLYRLEHSRGRVPNMSGLKKYDYLQRGESWRLVFENGMLVEKEIMTKEGNLTPGVAELTKDSTPIRRKER